ncbi:M48 family metallopeptidase [Parasporobacterium paucivorans]|uniref:YgjP-like metallopeptidase domain-containing protein n=1 Tax=Parasporobacterium paucivorans DSM 15970 TaxID=1122934 RepID=A0A1M6IUD3_9FIRM|nr:SprT family zinc-dependent metalloprotease [Parasporobacterium paucivorans]SHJ38035.1 hypothetical protein SAMN02745691_01856 [Parasporobacterium paucivorans DSM 15970]
MTLTYLDETIYYDLIYKNRKTISISIDMYARIEIWAPKGTTEKAVVSLLEEKWEWIQQNIEEMKIKQNGHIKKIYDQGETFLYLGSFYPIQITEDNGIIRDSVTFSGNMLHICVNQLEDEKIQKALKRFYYKECKRLIEKRIKYYQSNFKTKPHSISITENNSNWGTCNSFHQLTFNWKLAMAPLDVIDYVVVHEMCHMVHMNHDRSFWRLVGKFIPDYEKRQNWLALSNWKMIV